MNKESRKVIFALAFQSGFTPDEQEQMKMDEEARKRKGLFYGSEEIYVDGLKKLVFCVEDEESGMVYKVDPELVQFVK